MTTVEERMIEMDHISLKEIVTAAIFSFSTTTPASLTWCSLVLSLSIGPSAMIVVAHVKSSGAAASCDFARVQRREVLAILHSRPSTTGALAARCSSSVRVDDMAYIDFASKPATWLGFSCRGVLSSATSSRITTICRRMTNNNMLMVITVSNRQ